MTRITYKVSAEKPDLKIWWSDDDGTLIDLSSGYTFSVKLGTPGNAALLTKTSGVTGAAGTGTPGNGTPNLTVVWSAGELNLSPGSYVLQVTATAAGLDRVADFPIELRPVIS